MSNQHVSCRRVVTAGTSLAAVSFTAVLSLAREHVAADTRPASGRAADRESRAWMGAEHGGPAGLGYGWSLWFG